MLLLVLELIQYFGFRVCCLSCVVSYAILIYLSSTNTACSVNTEFVMFQEVTAVKMAYKIDIKHATFDLE